MNRKKYQNLDENLYFPLTQYGNYKTNSGAEQKWQQMSHLWQDEDLWFRLLHVNKRIWPLTQSTKRIIMRVRRPSHVFVRLPEFHHLLVLEKRTRKSMKLCDPMCVWFSAVSNYIIGKSTFGVCAHIRWRQHLLLAENAFLGGWRFWEFGEQKWNLKNVTWMMSWWFMMICGSDCFMCLLMIRSLTQRTEMMARVRRPSHVFVRLLEFHHLLDLAVREAGAVIDVVLDTRELQRLAPVQPCTPPKRQ